MSKRRRKPRGHPSGPEASTPQPWMARPAPSEQSSPRILVYALLTVAVLSGLYLHAYALPQLAHFADGMAMPDARVTGYTEADITAVQSALELEAAGQLNFLHRTAGVIFPVAFFLATWAVFGLLAHRRWRWAAVAGAGLFAVVDIAENIMIDRMLAQDPIQSGTVAMASTLTTGSWALLVVVGGSVVIFVVRDLWLSRGRTNQH